MTKLRTTCLTSSECLNLTSKYDKVPIFGGTAFFSRQCLLLSLDSYVSLVLTTPFTTFRDIICCCNSFMLGTSAARIFATFFSAPTIGELI